MTIDDNFYDVKMNNNFLSLSEILFGLEDKCNCQLLVSDWDRICNKYLDHYTRLKELNDNYKKGKYTLK